MQQGLNYIIRWCVTLNTPPNVMQPFTHNRLPALMFGCGFLRNWSLASISWYLERVLRSFWAIARLWTKRDMNFCSTCMEGVTHTLVMWVTNNWSFPVLLDSGADILQQQPDYMHLHTPCAMTWRRRWSFVTQAVWANWKESYFNRRHWTAPMCWGFIVTHSVFFFIQKGTKKWRQFMKNTIFKTSIHSHR